MEGELDQDSGLFRKRKLESLTSDEEQNQFGARSQDGSLPRKVICLSRLPKQPLVVSTNSNKGTQNVISSSTSDGLKLKLVIKSQTIADQSGCHIPPSSVLPKDGTGRKVLVLNKGPIINLHSGSSNIIKSLSSSKPVLDVAVKMADLTPPEVREVDSTDSGASSRTSSPYEPIQVVPNNVSDMIFPCLDATTFAPQSSSGGAFYPNLKMEVKQEYPSPSSSPPTSGETINQGSTGTVPRKVIVIAPTSTIPPSSIGDHSAKEEPLLDNPNVNANLAEVKPVQARFRLVERPMKDRPDKQLANLSTIKEEKVSFHIRQKVKPQPILNTRDIQLLDCKKMVKAEKVEEIKEEIESDSSEREPSLLDKILEQDRINRERLKAMTDPVIKGQRPFVKECKQHAIGRDFMVYNFSIDFCFIFLKTLLVRAKVLNGSENIVFRYEGVKREDTYTLRQAHEGRLPELVDMLIHVGQIEDVYIYFVPSSIKPSQGLEDPSLKFEQLESKVFEAVETKPKQLDKLTSVPEIPKTKGKKSAKGDSEKTDVAHVKKIQLWQFILVTLLEGKNVDKLIWIGDDGDFKFTNQQEFSKLWASSKGKDDMTYSNLSRSIRNYYKQGIMEKGSNNRFSYKFTFDSKSCTGYTIYDMRKLYEAQDSDDLEKLEKLERLKSVLAQPLKAAIEGTASEANEELPDCDDDSDD